MRNLVLVVFVLLFSCMFAVEVSHAQASVAPGAVGVGNMATVTFNCKGCAEPELVLNPPTAIGAGGCPSTPPVTGGGVYQLPLCNIGNTGEACIMACGGGAAGTECSGTLGLPYTTSLYTAVGGTYAFCGYDGVNPKGSAALLVSSAPTYTSSISIFPPPNYAYPNVVYPTILPGASANVVLSVDSAVIDPASDYCPYGICMLVVPPTTSLNCPTIITGAQPCNLNAVINTACLIAPNATPSASPNPPTYSLVYYSPNSLVANGLTYMMCGYYSVNAADPTYKGTPNTAILASGEEFLVNGTTPAAQAGLIGFTAPPSFVLGNSTRASFTAGPKYIQTFGNTDICGPGQTCYEEIGSADKSDEGCQSPLPPPSSSAGAVTSTCGLGVPQLPCILDTFSNGGNGNENSGGLAYTQVLNTAYLPDGNYMLCGYDYMNWSATQINNNPQPGLAFQPSNGVALFTSATKIVCASGFCNTVPTTNFQYLSNQITPPAPFGISIVGNLGPLQSTMCGVYGSINSFFLILALVLMIIGAAMYMASTAMPGSARGQVQGYAWGLMVVGVIGTAIATLSIWAISVAVNNSIQYVLTLC